MRSNKTTSTGTLAIDRAIAVLRFLSARPEQPTAHTTELKFQHPTWRWLPLLAAISTGFLLFCAVTLAQEPEGLDCGTLGISGGATGTAAVTGSDHVRFIYVTFPDASGQPDPSLPAAMDEDRDTTVPGLLGEFFELQSGGQFLLNTDVIRRLDDPNALWLADHTIDYYRNIPANPDPPYPY